MKKHPQFDKALDVGRPPNIKKLFPNSKALIVSGKVIDRAMLKKGNAMTIAANGRNNLVIRGTLMAAQKANAVVIIEIAKSEGGSTAYCAVNYWNMARQVDQIMNELNITIPVAIHADHYGLKNETDLEKAINEVPTMFDAGITSIAIDASHQMDDKNLLASLELLKVVPKWSGYETEVGEIKGKNGLSTKDEALFIIQGLNAHGHSPEWIALNNGTSHGLEDTGGGIQVDLTANIHEAINRYNVSGAQHGTSGNNSEKLRAIASKTKTTKANVATALQMISWGVEVNEFGNAILDSKKNLKKVSDKGISDELWKEMVAYADERKIFGGNYKKLNLHFESKILSQPSEIKKRSEQNVEDFVYNLLTNVFNATDTAPLAIDAIIEKNSYDMGNKAERIENPADWTKEKIIEKAKLIVSDKGPEGDYDD